MKTKTAKFVTIANQIKNGTYKRKIKIDLRNYFEEIDTDVWEPLEETRIQVREYDRSIAFIEKAVNHCLNTGDYSNLDILVLVYFKKTDEYKIIGGNHTSEIMIRLGIYESDAYVVDFEEDLQDRMSIAVDFGNELNHDEKMRQPLCVDDVKNIVMTHIEENVEAGLKDPRPSKEFKDDLLSRYTFITPKQLAGWCSWEQKTGGRRPCKSYSPEKIEQQWQVYKDMLEYEHHEILRPRELRSWDQITICTYMNKYIKGDTKLFLLIFYPENAAQTLALKTGEMQKKIRKLYDEYERKIGIKLDTVFLRG